MKPHKYADVIKAWADGAEVEWLSDQWGTWITAGERPDFNEDFEWRVKPQKRKYRVALLKQGKDIWTATENDTYANDATKNSFFVRYLTDWVEYDAE